MVAKDGNCVAFSVSENMRGTRGPVLLMPSLLHSSPLSLLNLKQRERGPADKPLPAPPLSCSSGNLASHPSAAGDGVSHLVAIVMIRSVTGLPAHTRDICNLASRPGPRTATQPLCTNS